MVLMLYLKKRKRNVVSSTMKLLKNIDKNTQFVGTYNLTEEMSNSYDYNYNLNPSGIYVGNEKFIVSVRGWHGNIRSWDGKNVLFIAKLRFDENIPIREHGNIIRILPDPDVEDARLFIWREEMWILCNGLNDTNKRHMFLVKINDAGGFFTGGIPIELCSVDSQNFEKNWSPFIMNNELYFVYSITPFVILKYDENSERCIKATFGINNFFQELSSYYFNNLHIRCGTPFLSLEKNEWIGIGHSVFKNLRKMRKLFHFDIESSNHYRDSVDDREWLRTYNNLYLMFFYTIKYINGTFIIDKVSYMFQPPFLQHDTEYITFPSGLTEDRDNYYVFFGENDTMSMMTRMDKKFVMNLLHDINTVSPFTYIMDTKFIEKHLK
jgi:hypothetical protein